MKSRLILAILAITSITAIGQRPILELTFTAENNGTYVQLDSIKVFNHTQGGDTVLYYPDTVLVLGYIYVVGMNETDPETGRLKVFQNYPNPVTDQTTIKMYLPEKGKVNINIMDILGREILKTARVLEKGVHSFHYTPGNGGLIFFTVQWQGQSSSIKMLNTSSGSYRVSSLEYIGGEASSPIFKASEEIQIFPYYLGDELLLIAYAENIESGILYVPKTNWTYTFQFATNIPCLGTPTVTYDGQVYNTIQIFNQCWLKENLNVGTMINSSYSSLNNGIIEKFCYNNNPDSCDKYGGLYQWNEMMQYYIRQQGICPEGWHPPTDDEWKVLERAVDNEYGISDPEWDIYGEDRGYNAGTNLKTTSGWYSGGSGTDSFGFSGLPGGLLTEVGGSFNDLGYYGGWWTSRYANYYNHWYRSFNYLDSGVYRNISMSSLSVRCIREEFYFPPIELTFTAVNDSDYVKLDSIKVVNRTQGIERILNWPDTTLILPVELPFQFSDEMLYIGYIDTQESGMFDSPEESQVYTFQFATNIPCPGTPTVTYEGQVYNTIQIVNQCWLKENLNVGTMIPGTQAMEDNGIIEKYCYNNEPDSCTKYGALYEWREMMQYTQQQAGVRGICPQGWHLPTDKEWIVLKGAVDSQYGIEDSEWNLFGGSWQGYDVGKNLKTTTGWALDCYLNTDLFGFSALPAGERFYNGTFYDISREIKYWSSSGDIWNYKSFHWLACAMDKIAWFTSYNEGYSVRCLRDE